MTDYDKELLTRFVDYQKYLLKSNKNDEDDKIIESVLDMTLVRFKMEQEENHEDS